MRVWRNLEAALDLGSSVFGRAGSSPVTRTMSLNAQGRSVAQVRGSLIRVEFSVKTRAEQQGCMAQSGSALA